MNTFTYAEALTRNILSEARRAWDWTMSSVVDDAARSDLPATGRRADRG